MCTANKGLNSVSVGQGVYQAMSLLNSKNVVQQPVVTTANLYHTIYAPANKIRLSSTSEELETVSVFDVAAYVLSKLKECTTMKLHKLLYYCQAWQLVWTETPLFRERIEAWANGPVIKSLFNVHRGLYIIHYTDLSLGNPSRLSNTQKENIDEVLDFYGVKSAQWLIDQTHIEKPWINARIGLEQSERGDKEITLESMHDYYASLN